MCVRLRACAINYKNWHECRWRYSRYLLLKLRFLFILFITSLLKHYFIINKLFFKVLSVLFAVYKYIWLWNGMEWNDIYVNPLKRCFTENDESAGFLSCWLSEMTVWKLYGCCHDRMRQYVFLYTHNSSAHLRNNIDLPGVRWARKMNDASLSSLSCLE